MSKGNLPDFRLVVKDKLSPAQTVVGVAWANKHGGISITLGPGVSLTSESLRDCYLTLWPWGPRDPLPPGRDDQRTPSQGHDDIPF